MKARQIAIALKNVYALAPTDELSFIERGADGLWGSWQTTGESAKAVIHGGQVVARIGLDDRVSALQITPRLPWLTWDIQATELAVAHLPDGAPVLVVVDGDDLAWHAWKPTPSSPWSDWQPLDGPITSVATDLIPGGGLVVFGIRDGAVYHRWQDRPLSAWKGWTSLEAPPGGATTLGVTTITHGGLSSSRSAATGPSTTAGRTSPSAPGMIGSRWAGRSRASSSPSLRPVDWPCSRSGRMTGCSIGTNRSHSANGVGG